MHKRSAALFLILLATTAGNAQSSQPGTPVQPRIRTVTAFVRLDRANYQAQVAEALKMLRAAKSAFTKAGYEVETIRITTQSFPEFTKGLSADQALEFFRAFDKLAQKEEFTPDIGAAMTNDSDDPAQADLLARVLAETQTINGFVEIADESGIHWNGVRAAARVIKYLEDHTVHSEGNFHFAAGRFSSGSRAILSCFAHI